MKCVEVFATKKVVRVSDEKAAKLVASQGGRYVPKSIWKAAGRERL